MQIDGHVPEMACGSGSSAEDHAIDQHRPANARAKGKQDDIAFSACAPPQDFRNQRGARVVVGVDRQIAGPDHIRQQFSFEKVADLRAGCSRAK